MAKSYYDLIGFATFYRKKLDEALDDNHEDKRAKDIIYNRGKYLYYLKQLHKLNSNEVLQPSLTGLDSPINIKDEIADQLEFHQKRIDKELSKNKKNADVKNNTLSKEVGLKIRRLATRASQVDFSHGKVVAKDVVLDSLGLAGTALKAPVMASGKIVSKVGPLAVTIFALPITLLASLLSFTADISDGKVADNWYNNTPVHKLTDALKDGVKEIGNNTYKYVGKM